MDKENNNKDNTPKKETNSAKEGQEKSQAKKESATKKDTPKKKNIFQRHPLPFLLIGALLISVLWGFLKANRIEKELTEKYETHINKLQEETGIQLAKTLSWSLRSEINRDNQESAEQYMINFLQGNLNIQSVKYIDSKSNKVVFATNKKDEGKSVEDPFILEAKEASMEDRKGTKLFVCPVFDIDAQLGTVVFEWIPSTIVNVKEVKEKE